MTRQQSVESTAEKGLKVRDISAGDQLRPHLNVSSTKNQTGKSVRISRHQVLTTDSEYNAKGPMRYASHESDGFARDASRDSSAKRGQLGQYLA